MEMSKELNLWDVINSNGAGASKENEMVVLASKVAGQSDTFLTGGKGLIAAGVVWVLFGKLGMFAAKRVAEQYHID